MEWASVEPLTEQENESDDECGRVEHGFANDRAVHMVEDLHRADVLGFDASRAHGLLLVREPRRSIRSIGEHEPRDDGQAHGDHAYKG